MDIKMYNIDIKNTIKVETIEIDFGQFGYQSRTTVLYIVTFYEKLYIKILIKKKFDIKQSKSIDCFFFLIPILLIIQSN